MGLFGAREDRSAPKGIGVKFHTVGKHARHGHMIAALSFHGTMPDGSAGKLHGRYIAAETAYWVTYLDALAVVLDFRDMEYRWGDSMLRVFQVLDQYLEVTWRDVGIPVPVKLLASEKSGGLYSLIPNRDVFFDTMEEAVAACDRELEAWFEAD